MLSFQLQGPIVQDQWGHPFDLCSASKVSHSINNEISSAQDSRTLRAIASDD